MDRNNLAQQLKLVSNPSQCQVSCKIAKSGRYGTTFLSYLHYGTPNFFFIISLPLCNDESICIHCYLVFETKMDCIVVLRGEKKKRNTQKRERYKSYDKTKYQSNIDHIFCKGKNVVRVNTICCVMHPHTHRQETFETLLKVIIQLKWYRNMSSPFSTVKASNFRTNFAINGGAAQIHTLLGGYN